jgi:dTDP-4-dehydrorhamnose 3,5-epimerase
MASELSVASKQARSEEGIRILGQRNGLELAIKHRSQRTLGDIITEARSAELIAGIVIEPLQVFADDRGFFAELARLGSPGIAGNMISGAERGIQISTTLTYPGTIKAIHYHYEQTDLWAPVAGMLQVFLYDLRRGSPTFGLINTLYVGSYRPWEILIPPGVAHGYRVLGIHPAQLVYLTDRFYNVQDEGRLPYDHPDVAYDWETQHK